MGTTGILNSANSELKIMEICGTHSEVISKFAIRQLYTGKIKLVSGPGCPVCVIPPEGIDLVIEYARCGFTVVTFGDLFRILGTMSSLSVELARGRRIKVVYSPLDALTIAKDNPSNQVVFIGVGFETTAPLVALTIMKAKEEGLKNFSVLSLHRTMPQILRMLFQTGVKLDGLILPGHVCAIIGANPFEFLAQEFGITGVVSGFAPEDVIESIETIKQNLHQPSIKIQYKRAVLPYGNKVAQQVIESVFEPCDILWRGFGLVKDSGLAIKQDWSFFDVRKRWPLEPSRLQQRSYDACCCDDIMKGILTPLQCPMFKTSCNPENPLGPCMVSSEGTCAIYYKYGG
ncbi:MAG: hydrogenase formation protein HypD [Thermoanaerobacteraceae bacterium]|nr:hydrogenase formation protein HypD [Thermoanaerobacteraceae bacterium]